MGIRLIKIAMYIHAYVMVYFVHLNIVIYFYNKIDGKTADALIK